MTASAVKGGKLIALTFDDGPSPYTAGLLDGLAKRNVKVTFFVVGQSAECYPKVVRRAYDEGHQIAQHTYNHPALTTKTNDQIQWQIQTTDRILDNILGQDLKYLIRTPYGDCNSRVLGQLGTANILWSVDSLDWQLLNSQKVCNEIVKQAYDGSIILVHDLHKTSVPGALAAIDILLERGYEFVTVSELFRRRGQELEAGKKYYSCKPNGIDHGPLADPTISVDNGKFSFGSIGYGSKVYYTTNGQTPTRNSTVYQKPMPLLDATLRYCAIADSAKTAVKTITITKNGNLFDDVNVSDWYFSAVDRAVAMKLFDGVGGYSFAPNTGLTRAMFVTVLYRMMTQLGENIVFTQLSTFPDLTQSWYKRAVSWAAAKGIVTGYNDGNFYPDRVISREEMCVILDRTLNWLRIYVPVGNPSFSDYDAISDWAKQSVCRISNAGLVNGMDGYFAPLGSATRAQSATVLLRLYDMLSAQ